MAEYDTGYADYDYSMLSPAWQKYFDDYKAEVGEDRFYSMEGLRNQIRQRQGFADGIDVLAKETAEGPLVVGGGMGGEGGLPDGTPVDEWEGENWWGNGPQDGLTNTGGDPSGTSDPGYVPPPTGGGGDPFVPPTGGDPAPVDWGNRFNMDNDLIGYDNSTNKDFYQRQFADMRNRTGAEEAAVMSAAIRRQAADNAPKEEMGDPWDWMGGSEQFAPAVNDGTNTGGRSLADKYSGLTNQQIALAVAPNFTDKENEWFQDYFDESGAGDKMSWGQGGYDNNMKWIADGGFNTDNKSKMSSLMNKLYPDSTNLVNGLPVPVGYASPVNPTNIAGGGTTA